MSFNIANYMDGVPVKISEKYKPPPTVTIPQAVQHRISTTTPHHYESPQFTYSFQLEKQVKQKLAEWKMVRETERENRRERIRRYELQKCRDIEAKQKQLLTAVSYPSTDDLSSDDGEDDNKTKQLDITPQPIIVQPISRHPAQSFDTILQPILANSYSSACANATHASSTVFNSSKINYSDFENDTSSPFDNIELKTINDLDILAQVLNDTQKHSIENGPNTVTASTEETPSEVSDSQTKHLQPQRELEPIVNNAPASGQSVTYESPVITNTSSSSNNHNQVTSNYYYTSNVIPTNYQMMVHQMHTMNLHQPQNHHHQQQQQQYMMNYANMNHHHSTDQSAADAYFNYNSLPATSNHNYLPIDNYVQHRDYYTQPKTSVPATGVGSGAVGGGYSAKYDVNGGYVKNYCDSLYGVHAPDMVGGGLGAVGGLEGEMEAEAIPKSKSKSVPDILKELKDEIRSSEMRRSRNHSQTIDDHEKRNSADSAKWAGSSQSASRSSSSSSTSFMKLSPSSQTLAKNISSMGFPLERVAKIAELYGNDDKKIVEHLIPLSELLDLGFDESRISEALVKFDNNKEKALDFLIS